MIKEKGLGLRPTRLYCGPPEEYPFFKSPFVDEKNIFHWFAYLSDETFETRDLPVSDWLQQAGKEFQEFCGNNGLVVTEPVFTVNYISTHAFREIHGKAGLIRMETNGARVQT